MDKEVKVPKQERSIQKKQQIIKTGFELFSKNGYYHTNTAEIAKAAGVSTGIVYRYFPDKKAIFLAGLEDLMIIITQKVKEHLEPVSSLQNMELSLSHLVNAAVEAHYLALEMHEEINAMIHSDKDVATIYYQWEDQMTQVIVNCFPKLSLDVTNANEKVHMIIHMVENYCHEIVFHKHTDMDYDAMKRILIQTISYILQF